MSITAIRGTRDLLPDDLRWWRKIETTARDVFERFGYREIRTPLFEATELFVRGVGEGTDIVEKEMYTFTDKGNRSVTLRPEGTASVVRACLEHNLFDQSPIQKLYYVGPMYRYERPQAGRYREFWQAGIEAFGVADATMDAEVLTCAHQFLSELGIKPLVVQLNSIGDEERPAYIERLKDYVRPNLDEFCGQCRYRFERNTLRLLDCKTPSCRELMADAPKITDYLSAESASHFDTLRRLLDAAGVAYVVNPRIVRGLDYYTRTAFEITTEGLGSQDTVLAGGRYDRLVKDIGGRDVPGIGFAAGIDRVMLAMQNQGQTPEFRPPVDVYIATIGKELGEYAFKIATTLRQAGISAEMEFDGRSLRAQMKTADKLGVRFTVIVGGNELAENAVTVRRMEGGEQERISLEGLEQYLLRLTNSS